MLNSKIKQLHSRLNSLSFPHLIARQSQLPFARSIRFGLLSLLPYYMLSTIVQILVAMATLLTPDSRFLTGSRLLVQFFLDNMPLAIWACIGTARAIRLQLPRAAIAASCIGFALIVQMVALLDDGWFHALLLPLSIFGPLGAVPLIDWLRDKRFCHVIARETSAGETVSEAINLIVPVLLTALVVFVLAQLLATGTALVTPHIHWSASTSPLLVAMQYCLFNSLLWEVGVHGYYALVPLLNHFQNLTTHLTDLNLNLFGPFVFIGGSGATLSLTAAVAIWSRNKKRKILAFASLIPAFFNVNELILFGLPIILNIRLLLPFILAPLVNLCISATLIHFHVITLAPITLPFNAPMIFNAWLSASPGIGAVGLQLALVLLDTLIYMPFVKSWDSQRITDLAMQLSSSTETAYLRGQEANQFTTTDPIPPQQNRWADGTRLKKNSRRMKDAEIEMYYQPQVLPKNSKTVACEALIRLVLPTGEALSPLEFLEDMAHANLSHELDLWVVTKVCEQMRRWEQLPESNLIVSINITAATLSMPAMVEKIAQHISHFPGRIVMEITEQAIVVHGTESEQSIKTLRAAGAHIHLDDFGTGYSSLAYLSRLPIDGIKIDRSFVHMLDDQKGRVVFQALCKLANKLKLDVIVEGIETDWQLSQLPTDLIIVVQGWYYSPALSPEQLAGYLVQDR